MKAKIIIFALLSIFGFLLATLGLISFPVFHNVNYFWPAAVVQAVGSILFGWTGIIAGTVFPIFANYTTDKSLMSLFCYTPSNFIQSFLPYYLYTKRINPQLNISNFKGAILFAVCAGVIPQLCGGILAGGVLSLIGQIGTWEAFLKLVFLWFIDSVPWIVIFGIPILIIFVPLLKDSGYLFSLEINNEP
ncbi:hypothetical protein ACFL6Y_05805 [Elusimicrobiota bacterium]